MAERRIVRVVVDEYSARVDPADRPLVEPLVSARAVRFHAKGGVVGQRVSVPAGTATATGYVVPSKLVPRVAVGLTQAGYEVVVEHTRRERPVAPDPTRVATVAAPAARLLRPPFGSTGGLVRFGRDGHPFAVVPDILRCYPTARAVVAVKNRRAVLGWVDALRRAGLPQRVVTIKDLTRAWGNWPKILVGTLHTLDSVQPHDFDVVVAPEAGSLRGIDSRVPVAGRAEPAYLLPRYPYIPAFGFVDHAVALSARENLALGALFGPEIRIGGPAAVSVVAHPDPTAVPPGLPDPERDPIGYKQAAIWGNTLRTAWIAATARDAADGTEQRVMVMAEAAHAPVLAEALGWPLLTPMRPGASPPPARAVVTEAWAFAQRPLPADVLIDARGWGPLALPGFPPRAADSVTLIDAGVSGAAGARLAAARLADYRRRGWAAPESAR